MQGQPQSFGQVSSSSVKSAAGAVVEALVRERECYSVVKCRFGFECLLELVPSLDKPIFFTGNRRNSYEGTKFEVTRGIVVVVLQHDRQQHCCIVGDQTSSCS